MKINTNQMLKDTSLILEEAAKKYGGDYSCIDDKIEFRHEALWIKIIINNDWVGCELEVYKILNNYNKSIHYDIDTDLYDLNYKPNITLEIFDEIKNICECILKNTILIGKHKKKNWLLLAFPTKNNYTIIIKKMIFETQYYRPIEKYKNDYNTNPIFT